MRTPSISQILLATVLPLCLGARVDAQPDPGTLIVGDLTAQSPSAPGAGMIFLTQLIGDTTTVYFNELPLETPFGVHVDREGRILVADRTAQLDGVVDGIGSLFRIDPVTRTIELEVGSELFRRLTDLDVAPDGSILLVDREADPLGHGTDTGAIFRVDPVSGAVSLFSSPPEFVDPAGVLVDSLGAVFVIDENANPLAHPHDSGAIWEVDPGDGSLIGLVGSPDVFSTPLDAVRLGDHLYVVDTTAEVVQGVFSGSLIRVELTSGAGEIYPLIAPIFDALVDVEYHAGIFYLLDRDADFAAPGGAEGGVYIIDPANRRASRFAASTEWVDPQSFVYFPNTQVGLDTHQLLDLNGGGLVLDDSVRVSASISSLVAVEAGFTVLDTMPSEFLLHPGSISSTVGQVEVLTEDPLTLRWSGSLDPFASATFQFEGQFYRSDRLRLPVDSRLSVSDDSGGLLLSVAPDTLVRGLRPDELVVADPRGFFDTGRIAVVREGGEDVEIIVASPQLFNPAGVVVDSLGWIYIADRDSDIDGSQRFRGALFRYRPLEEAFEVLSTDTTWRDPVDVALFPNGDLALLDNDARPFGGPGVGAIYRLDRTTGAVLDVITDDRWESPSDLATVSNGDMLMADRQANPFNYPPPSGGAIFRITPGGVVSVDVSSPQLVDPSGVAPINEDSYYIADWNADPYGTGTGVGAVFRGVSGGAVTVVAVSSQLMSPSRLVLSRAGDLLVSDTSTNHLLAVDPQNGRVSLYTDDDALIRPAGLTLPPASRFDDSQFLSNDTNGGALVAGDRVFYFVLLRNTGDIGDEQTTLVNDLPDLTTLEDGSLNATTGAVDYDPATHQVTWEGSVPVGGFVTVSYGAVLDEVVAMGSRLINRGTIFPSRTFPHVFADTLEVSGTFLGGDLLLLDFGVSGDDGRGALYRRNFQTNEANRVLDGHDMVWPINVSVDPERRALIVDQHADPFELGTVPGAVFRYDPQTDEFVTLTSVADYRTPADVMVTPDDRYLLLDRDANPFGHPGSPGAIFEFDPNTGAATPLVSDERFLTPISFVRDLDGTILVLDRDARPLDPGQRGAIFRVDLTTSEVTAVVSDSTWALPVDLLLHPSGDYLVADRDADPLGLGGNTGAVFRIDRDDLTVSIYAASASLVNPISLQVSAEGHVLVAEAAGSIIEPRVWRVFEPSAVVINYWTPGDLVDPRSIFVLDRPQLASSGFEVDDMSGFPVEPGDELHYRLVLRNQGLNPADPLFGDITLSDQGTVDGGSIGISDGSAILVGDVIEVITTVPSADSIEVWFDFTVAAGLSQGTRIETMAALDAGNGIEQEIFDLQRIPFEFFPDDLIVTDRSANPDQVVGAEGTLFKYDATTDQLNSLSSLPGYRRLEEVMIDPLDSNVTWVVDSRANPLEVPGGAGAVFTIDTRDGRLLRTFASELFVDPTGIFFTSAGDPIIVDRSADPDMAGTPQGALFSLDRVGGGVSVLLAHPSFQEPRDGVALPDGDVLIVDSEANPLGLEGNVGTVFRGRPATGVVTVASTGGYLTDPVAIHDQGGGAYVIVDENADPGGIGGDTGALLRFDAGADRVDPLAVSPLFVSPQRARIGVQGEIYVADEQLDGNGPDMPGRGAILRWHPADGEVVVYVTGPELIRPIGIEFLDSPTPVRSLTLQAREIAAGRVQVAWEAIFSGDIRRADVYRTRGLGEPLPPGDAALITPDGLSPETRVFVDSTATPGGIYDYWVGLTEADGTVTLSGSARVTLLSGVPAVFALAANRPNPFESRTSIAFDVPASGGRVVLQVFDLTGRRIRNLVDEQFAAGRFAVTWDGVDEQGRRVAPGVYFYRMTAPAYQETRRLIVVR